MATTEAPKPEVAPTGPGATGRFFDEAGEMSVYAGETVRALPGSVRYFSEVMRLTGDLISGTLLLMAVMCAFLGVTTTNFAFFFLRTIGATDFTGAVTGIANARVTSLIMFGYVFTSKVCCGLCAELGAMKVSEEIDGIEAEGVDPMKYIVGTRILAVMIFLPIASAVSLTAALFGEWLNVVVILKGLSSESLLTLHWQVQSIPQNLYAFIAQASVGVVTAIVACFYGMRASGGAAAVGSAVARSLVVNLVLLHAIAGFFVLFFYADNLSLPIGG